jgi:predicted nucleotidyltransferase
MLDPDTAVAEARRRLQAIEARADVTILYAVESGSRAWGFASTDSDYDVRFVYVGRAAEYLRLDQTRDVIEEPIDGVWDVNGWDLAKTLRLAQASNPTIFEWLRSPLVYMATDFWRQRVAPTIEDYFSVKKGVYHYLSMARSNYRAYLLGDEVQPKKYFYALRPVLACQSILAHSAPPPIAFADLVAEQLDPSLAPVVQNLLDHKAAGREHDRIPPLPQLNDYIARSIDALELRAAALPNSPAPAWDRLNDLFRSAVAVHD